MRLTRMRCGESAPVTCIEGEACLVRRLYALGIRPGRVVSVIRHAPFGGPLHLHVGSTELFLRWREADSICVGNVG